MTVPPADLRDRIAWPLVAARQRTAGLTECVEENDLVRQHSPLMSPLVWDLAHIGNQEELWLLRGVGGRDPMQPQTRPALRRLPAPAAAPARAAAAEPDRSPRLHRREVRGPGARPASSGPVSAPAPLAPRAASSSA